MIFLLNAITPQITQKDNSVTLLLIVIMPQIIHKRVISLVNFAYLSQWLSGIVIKSSTLRVCVSYNQISL